MKTTSIKVKYRPSATESGMGVIYYQVIHLRKVRQLITEYHIYNKEWDEKRATVVIPHRGLRHDVVVSVCESIRLDVDRLVRIKKCLDAKGLAYTADDLVDEYRRYEREYTLFRFMESLIVKFRRNGKRRTSETYTSALKSFKKFMASRGPQAGGRPGGDVMLDALTSETMEAFQAWHKAKGNSLNTISFYARILRAVYNRAVDGGAIDNRYPFRHVYTGAEKTVKRALPLAIIKKIKELDLSGTPSLAFARDMFLLSFYMRGISFIDMVYLKKSDKKGGAVVYRRRKTGQQLIVGWTREMQSIIDKYPRNPTRYLLPIVTSARSKEHSVYHNIGYNINHNLKKVAKMVGVHAPLTMYVARHSWASAAKAKGIPLSVISEGMGHDSEATTQIYLASLETSVVDKANEIIISSLS